METEATFGRVFGGISFYLTSNGSTWGVDASGHNIVCVCVCGWLCSPSATGPLSFGQCT